MNVLELFAGIGGIGLGLERAGMTVVGQVELDDYCRRVLAKHWPNVPRHDDVRTAAEWWLSTERPTVDVICGGFPCQDISAAGRRAGIIDGQRSSLWTYLAHCVRVLRPRYVLVENVAALLVRGLDVVAGDLAALGYDLRWDCIPAAAVGARHRRDRWFGIAYPGGVGQRTQLADLPARQPDAHRSCADLADARGQRRNWRSSVEGVGGSSSVRIETRDHVGHGGAACVADAHGVGRDGQTRLERPSGWGQPAHSGQWGTEPDVGRVVARLSLGMDGDLNAHPSCLTQASATGIPQTDRLRALREHLATPAASSEPARCALCGHPLSGLPCRGACAPWQLGSRREKAEDLRCMREGLLGLLARSSENLLARLPDGTWTAQRTQAVGSRTDRLRALGNAVVPQVAEHIGGLIVEHSRAAA